VTGVGERGALEMQCKCAKVERENKGTSGRVDWGERDEQEMQCKGAKVEK